jgi:hypothetical protein
MTWENVDSATWSMLELVCGIVCANLATLRPLLKTVWPSLGESNAEKGSAPSGSHGTADSSRRGLRWPTSRTAAASTGRGSTPRDTERQDAQWELNGKPSNDSLSPKAVHHSAL